MRKLIFVILIATITIFAQKTANWLFLGKSTDRTSVYMDINSVKQSGNSVQFIGKMETLTGFKANCKTFEFIAYGTGGAGTAATVTGVAATATDYGAGGGGGGQNAAGGAGCDGLILLEWVG